MIFSFRWRVIWLLCIVLLVMTGCDTILPKDFPPFDALSPARESPAPPATQTPEPTPTQVPIQTQEVSGSKTIKIWLPPQFDPDSNTPAGNVLKSRLQQFTRQNPDVEIDVRVKDVEGEGGILGTLVTASAAAQSALPDLVILPHEQLESTVREGVLFPFDNLSTTLDNPDWYNFAREMAYIQDKIYGLPFAADMQVQVYQSEAVSSPLSDATAVIGSSDPLIFQAGDPLALYTQALYQASGGEILDEDNQPSINASILSEVLIFFQQASESGSLPFWLTGYQRDDQSWNAFKEGRGNQIVTWLSRFLSDGESSMSVTKIPTLKGLPYALSSGWLWALSSPLPSKHPISVQLAEFLTEGSFLAEWTAAMNLMPPRPGSLQSWSERIRTAVVSPSLPVEVDTLAKSLHPFPNAETLGAISSAFEKATVDVLKGLVTPEEAALQAAAGIE